MLNRGILSKILLLFKRNKQQIAEKNLKQEIKKIAKPLTKQEKQRIAERLVALEKILSNLNNKDKSK